MGYNTEIFQDLGSKLRKIVPGPSAYTPITLNLEESNIISISKYRSPHNQQWSPKSSIKRHDEEVRLHREKMKPGPGYYNHNT